MVYFSEGSHGYIRSLGGTFSFETGSPRLGRYGVAPTGSDVVHLSHGGAVSTGWGRLLTLLKRLGEWRLGEWRLVV